MGTEDKLRQSIRDAGLRATLPRLKVLLLLHQQSAPTSHSEVTSLLEDQGLDRATLYRNLTDLTEVGLLRRVDVGDHVWRFELASQPAHTASVEHPHFLCTACGDVACLPELDLPTRGKLPRALQDGQVTIQLRGLCDDCYA